MTDLTQYPKGLQASFHKHRAAGQRVDVPSRVDWQPLPHDPAHLPFKPSAAATSSAPALSLHELPLPSTPLVEAAKAYLKDELGEQIWMHSHRSFIFGWAIQQTQLADVEFDAESLYLACLFHDLGCTEKNVKATRLSFEYYSGILARQWLLEHEASKDLADAVAEAIFRHTDFCKGDISSNGALIQLGTLFDNIHAHAHLLPEHFVGQVHEAYPRENWGMCFKTAMERELALKPWAHASEIAQSEGAAWDKILNNQLEALARVF